jgi:hypothetical protein
MKSRELQPLVELLFASQFPEEDLAKELVSYKNLRLLDEAVSQAWWLSSSHIKQLLLLNTLPKSPFQRYGFCFTKSGRNGTEVAWQVTKIRTTI